MTSPLVVGSVAVEVSASARGFAKSLRDAVTKELKDAGFDKMLSDILGKKPIKIPVQPDFDPKSFPKSLPGQPRAPRSSPQPKTDTDALLKAFQQDVQRQLRALSKQAITIPVRPDTDDLRAGIGEQITSIERHLRVEVPVDPPGRREYERSLRDMVETVSQKVKVSLPAPEIKEPKPVKVPVQVDPLTKAFQQDIQRQINALANTANAKIPVSADTAGLREQLAAQIALVQRTLKAEIPTEPGSRAVYEARLRAMVGEATRTVHANIPVEVDRNRFQQAIASIAAHLPRVLGSAFQQVGDAANSAGKVAVSTFGVLASAAATVVNPATLAAAAILGTVAAAVSLGPAAGAAAGGIGVLGGALGSLPALAVGGGAVFATFGLALAGLADRFKDVAKSGGGAGASVAAQARQIAAAERGIEQANRSVAAAERGLASAQRESLRAQQAITAARKAATDRIEDLGRALRGAALDEEDAQLRIAEAEQALRDARRGGKSLEIRRAEQDLKAARFAAEEAAEAASDLADVKAESDRKGVEGSDEVVAALDRQRAANEQIISAQDGLKSAQEGLIAANEQLAAAHEKVGASAASAAAKMLPLSPAAQKFIDTIKGLKPAFEDLRLSVQDRFFSGLDKTVKQVSDAWLPQLKTTLGRYADTFNGFFKTLGTNVSQPAFITNLAAAAESIRKAFDRIGQAVSGPLVDAFGRLSKAAGPFIEALGDEIAQLVTDFSNWIIQADKSGKLNDFFETATGYLHDLFDIGRSVGSIIKSLIEILFGGPEDGKKGSGIVESFQKLADFLKDPENQAKIREYIARFIEFGRILLVDVLPAVMKVAFAIWSMANDIKGAVDSITDGYNRIKNAISDFVTNAVEKVKALPDQIGTFLSNLPEKVSTIFTDLITRAGFILGFGLGAMVRAVFDFPTNVANALGELKNKVGDVIQGAIDWGVSVISTILQRGPDAVSGLGGKIRSALSNLGPTLFNIGHDLVVGLWNGITSMGNWLRDRISGFASSIISGFRKGFDSHSPSRKMIDVGVTLPQGLAVGMERDLAKVMAARDAIVAAATPSIAANYAGQFGAAELAGLATPAAPSPTRLVAEWVGGAGDPLVRGLRDHIRVYYDASPQKAFGTGVR